MFDKGQPGKTAGAATAFGSLLRRLRVAAGLSQEALAERARISTEAVGALERGTRQAPQRQTLALLIEALEVDGADRASLEAAAVRPSAPRRRAAESSLVGVVSALRLPEPLTSFVGRELDLTLVLGALSEARLVSLVGPGGVGKSRLALEAARRAGERFNEGVALVELAPVGAGASVVSSFAAVLGVVDEGAVRLLDRLVAACGDGRRLIVVDNCEHVLDDTAAVVFALLSACPNLRVIATSREPLRVEGEQIFRLGPLPADAALELFVDRAKAVAPYLHFPAEARRLAAQICRRVDGIPLAIELAASRTDMFDLSTILKRLQERFKLLASRSRTMHPHHRTLRALVDWSYDLLDEDEARVFRRLGIFAGGCRFDDAEQILAFDGVGQDRVVELLACLHDKSLIDVDRADPPRFSMLQTMHDYAQERLTDAGEADRLQLRYAAHYLQLVVANGPRLRCSEQGEAIERLSTESDNLRAALGLSGSNAGLRELGLHAVGPLALYWIRTGALTEGSMLIEALTGDVREPSVGLAWACTGAAWLEFNRRRIVEAHAYAERGFDAAAACGDEWMQIWAEITLNEALTNIGERPEAAALAVYERAQALGDPWLVYFAAFDLGFQAMERGDAAGAIPYFNAALELARPIGDELLVWTTSLQLGRVLAKTEPARASRLIVDAMDLIAPGAMLGRAECLESLALIALSRGRTDHAVRLVRLASAFRTAVGERPRSYVVDAVATAVTASNEEFDADGDQLGAAPLAEAGDAAREFLAAMT